VSIINYAEIKSIKVPDSCLRRISRYYRTTNQLLETGVESVTSKELAEVNGAYPDLVRKDLSYFGCFGKRGIGYNVGRLRSVLANILGLDRKWGVAVIGAARYSCVLMNSLPLKSKTFNIRKIYDKNPEKIKGIPRGIRVLHIDNLESTLDPSQDKIVIIALPSPELQGIINRLGRIGIKAVLYMASKTVKIPDDMEIINQDISVELGMLTYRLNVKGRGVLYT
jgi:redox-sensing transcriptional repressor